MENAVGFAAPRSPPHLATVTDPLSADSRMIDYEIGRCSRRCYITGRELREGEICYSALVPDGLTVVRRDYATEAWEGPPEGAIGWWKTVVVDPAAGRATWA